MQKLSDEGKNACLAVVQVGNDPASSVYVNNKKKACAYIGIRSKAYELPEETTEAELVSLVEELNRAEEVTEYLYSFPCRDILMRTILSGQYHRIKM